ncbi:hypothetical protein ACJMK2_033186, partial [Sinanodonta woodiana]
PPPIVSTSQERKTGLSNMATDGYEVIDISYDDPEITPEQEEIIHDSTGNCITTYSDTSG